MAQSNTCMSILHTILTSSAANYGFGPMMRTRLSISTTPGIDLIASCPRHYVTGAAEAAVRGSR